MKRETKNQIFTVIVLLLFVGSGIAYAIFSVFPVTEKPKIENVVDKPLSDAEEAQYLTQNKVVIKYFYSPTCVACQQQEPILEEVINYFDGNMLTEKINIFEYRDQIAVNDIKSTPTFIIKGKSIEQIEDVITKDDLVSKVCGLYFEPIDKCSVS